MNANELADAMMKFYNLEENTAPIQIYDLVATMLRQQQAEIEELTKKYNNLKQWERRYLDVIKSLTKDQKQALNEELRTYNGKRT